MRYLVQERIFSFKADFWIEDENGERVFFVDGKALSLRETFELRDASGDIRALIRKKLFAMRVALEIEDRSGVIATVRPAFFSPIRHRYEVTLADGSRLEATGNFTTRTGSSLATGDWWGGSPGGGSESGTPTGWRSSRARMTPSSSPSPSALTGYMKTRSASAH